MKMILTLVTLLLTFTAFAHEGHDHGTGQIQPTKGGVIQKAGNIYFEVVGTQSELKVYPLKEAGPSSKILKPVPLKEVKITATYKLPRKPSPTSVTFVPQTDFYKGSISASGAHRYEVLLKVEAGSVKDEITYQIEPQE